MPKSVWLVIRNWLEKNKTTKKAAQAAFLVVRFQVLGVRFQESWHSANSRPPIKGRGTDTVFKVGGGVSNYADANEKIKT